MTLYYSATTGGFHDSDVHARLPDDALEITPQTHQTLLKANAGASIAADKQGYPQAIFFASDEALATINEIAPDGLALNNGRN